MKKKILFLYHSDLNWHNIYPLYQMFVASEQYICEVCTVPQYLKPMEEDTTKAQSLTDSVHLSQIDCIEGKPDGQFQVVSMDLLKKQNITFIDGEHYKFQENEYELVIYGYPYENLLYEEFHIRSMRKYAKKIAYIPYGIDVSAGVSVDLIAYGLPIHYQADAIFMQSESARKRFLRFHPSSGNRVFALSTPRFDSLFNLNNRTITDIELEAKKAGRFTVLWNSHFSFIHNRWSTLEVMFEPLFRFFSSHKDIALIWRLHPNTKYHLLETGFMTNIEYVYLIDEIKKAGIIVDESNNHLDAFQLSDCMITDASSLCIEYIGTGKPMLLLDNPEGTHFFDEYFNEMFTFYERASEPEKVLDFIKNTHSGKDPKANLRKMAQKKFVYKFDGMATNRIFNKLLDLISTP